MNSVSLAARLYHPLPGDHPLAFGEDHTVTWADFLRDVDLLMSEMDRHNIGRWMLCFADSYYFAVAFFAVVQAGKQILIPGNLQPDALSELLNNHDGCLHDDVFEPGHGVQVTLPIQGRTHHHLDFSVIEPANINITLLTSGSTGEPKPADKSLADLDAEVIGLEKMWGGLIRDCRIIGTVSHQHIYGLLFRVLWPLCAGRAFDRHQLNYPEQVVSHARKNAVLISSPAMLKRVEEVAGEPYRAVFSSGGPLPFDAAVSAGVRLGSLPFEVFGSTETGGIGWRQQVAPEAPWTFFDGITAGLDDQGCLKIQSPYISPKQWYQTSDGCRMLDGARFLLLGRVDRVVKIEEKRVSLVEVEKRLNGLEWIKDASVLQVGGPDRLTLGAVLVLTPEGRQLQEQMGKGRFWLALRQELRRWLEPAAVPRVFRVVDEIPVNSQGKKTERELKRLFQE